MTATAHPTAIHEGLVRAARRSPQAVALRYRDRSWSYAELLERTLTAAGCLAGLGVSPGDRVAFLARNSDAYAIGWLATQALGAVHVPVNFMLGASEVAYVLGHAEPAAFFAGSGLDATADAAAAAAGSVRARPIDELLAGGPPVEITAPERADGAPRVAQLAYTSGTEAAPKGALLTDAGLVYQYVSCLHAGEYAAGDVAVHALPLYHCAQMHCFLTPQLFLSAENVVLDRADPAEIVATVRERRATSFFAPPTVWIGILNQPGFRPDDLRTLQKGYYGASIMPVEVLRALRRELPWLRLWNYYGQTEIGPLATVLRPEEHDERPSSIGRPVLFVETRVVDDDMRDVEPGAPGEIVHRSPQLLQGYYRDPEQTAIAFRGGWFHSGDLAVADAEGYLEIVDRKKDMIKSGGENVASREVEEAIYRHPEVAEVAVIGLPDPTWVEKVCAAVVLREGASASASEIVEATAGVLAPFKRPKEVFFLDALPKNPSGKILKRELRLRVGGTEDLRGARRAG